MDSVIWRALGVAVEIRVLVVDDYAFVRAGLRAMLEAETAVSRIRAKWSDIRVLVLIPAGNEDALFASIRAGASGYVPMEVSAGDLAHAVRTVAAGQSLIDPTVIQKVRRSHAIEDKLARLSLVNSACWNCWPRAKRIGRSPTDSASR